MDKIPAKTAVEELTLLLMYLTRTTDNYDFGTINYAWKGYSFNVLSKLDEAGYIDKGRYKNKSVQLYKAGVEEAKALMEKYNISDER